MAMRTRVTDLPRPQPRERHGPRADVVGILTASRMIQAQIDKTMAHPLTDLHRIESGLRYWTALVQLKHHVATLEVWLPLCQAINIGMLLCEEDIGLDHLQLFIEAQEAIFRAYVRGDATGSYRLDGPGIRTITEALEIHDAQLEVALRSDLALAERTMHQRNNDGHHYDLDRAAA